MRDLERKLLYAAVLLLGIVVGYLAWPTDPPVSPPDPPVSPPEPPVAPPEPPVAPPEPPGCPASSLVSNFTLLYENARLNDEEDITSESVGVGLAPRHERRLERIAVAFKACQREAGIPVKFGVTGYSSTAKFQRKSPDGGVGMSNSDELNLKTANLRAKLVADYLRKKDFEVELKKWGSFENLRRPYLDDSPPGTDKETLNRTVFIEVLHAAACDLSQLPRPVR